MGKSPQSSHAEAFKSIYGRQPPRIDINGGSMVSGGQPSPSYAVGQEEIGQGSVVAYNPITVAAVPVSYTQYEVVAPPPPIALQQNAGILPAHEPQESLSHIPQAVTATATLASIVLSPRARDEQLALQQLKQTVNAVAAIGYDAQSSDELQIEVGDSIIVKGTWEDGVAYGTNVLDPTSYSAPQPTEDATAAEQSASLKPVASTFIPVSRNSSLKGAVGVSTAGSPLAARKMKAIKAYVKRMDDEVDLKVGDVVVVRSSFDDGWAYGVVQRGNRSETGFFPMSALETIRPESLLADVVSSSSSQYTSASSEDDGASSDRSSKHFISQQQNTSASALSFNQNSTTKMDVRASASTSTSMGTLSSSAPTGSYLATDESDDFWKDDLESNVSSLAADSDLSRASSTKANHHNSYSSLTTPRPRTSPARQQPRPASVPPALPVSSYHGAPSSVVSDASMASSTASLGSFANLYSHYYWRLNDEKNATGRPSWEAGDERRFSALLPEGTNVEDLAPPKPQQRYAFKKGELGLNGKGKARKGKN
ncbi:SH3-domain kinase binding protein 1 [Quaeritorhiza haematococci]|nr:SH3-domain kinase binding protein 1 [Quaeritorhiza haematococci]